MNHAIKILLLLVSLIPMAGLIIQICYSIWLCNNYQTYGFYSQGFVQVRDSRINRWLFDDIKWNEYDEQKHLFCRIHKTVAQAKEEKERREKLIEGLHKEDQVEYIVHDKDGKPKICTRKNQKVIDVD